VAQGGGSDLFEVGRGEFHDGCAGEGEFAEYTSWLIVTGKAVTATRSIEGKPAPTDSVLPLWERACPRKRYHWQPMTSVRLSSVSSPDIQ
jgi:hypothetical protein